MIVASATRNGSSIRRRASLYTQKTVASQKSRTSATRPRLMACHVAGVEEVVNTGEDRCRHKEYLPISQPATKRQPNVEGEQDGGEDEDARTPTGPRKSYGF